MLILRILAVLTVLSGCLSVRAATGGVIISEIMYHPPGTNVLEEWMELHNPGSKPVSLDGWRIDRGVHFTFPPQTVLPAGGRLVVAADAATFHSRHPEVSGYLAGWTGTLRDNGETIALIDAAGVSVAEVTFAPEGDWAVRKLGAPDSRGRVGWIWVAGHDGLGKSLELINPSLPNGAPHNWASSTAEGGTPGRPNSAESADTAPLVVDVGHFPLIPTATDPVTIHVRLLDERSTGLSALLLHRQDGTAAFTRTPMWDDGKHGDGLAGDGLFAAQIPPHPDGTVIEFHFEVSDAVGHARAYPAVLPSGTDRTAYFLYQVDNEPFTGPQPLYRLIMNRAELDYLRQTWSNEPDSDAEVSGTFIGLDAQVREGATAQVRYTSSFRNRGHGTRVSVPHNFRVGFPKDRPWQGREGLNLNTQFTPSQVFGSMLMRRARLPMAEAKAVRVRVNGEDLAGVGSPQFGAYAANELVDDSLVERQYPSDPNGNVYRGIRDVYPGNPRADLAWHGADFSNYTNAYFKRNHVTENNWADLVHLLDVLNNTPDATYESAVAQVADVREWMRYFAVNTLMGNQETALATGYGDDFALYSGTADRRFRLLAYDMDSVLGSGTRSTTYADGLFKMFGSGTHRIPVLERLIQHPSVAPMYYEELKVLSDSLFASEWMDPLLDQLASGFAPGPQIDGAIATMKAFNASQRAYVIGEVPLGITTTDALPIQSGYPRTTGSSVALSGRANAITTRSVRVNGKAASWSAWEAVWSANSVTLHPGINRMLIQAFDASGQETDRATHDVWFDDGSLAAAGGAIAANTVWSAAGGPYVISGDMTIGNGATLTVEAGTSVYLASGAHLNVSAGGRLLAEGTPESPIRFTRPPGSSAAWGGIVINGAPGSPENRIAHAHLEFNGTTAIEVAGGTVLLDHLTFGNTDRQYLALDGASFVVSHCIFPTSTTPFELVHGTQGIKSGGHGIIRHCFFGTTSGYNDIVDFTGGNRAGQPIIHFINNVFTGATDDILDLDNTDAWIEGNLFLHVHKNGSPDSASAVSGGNDNGQPSEITLIGNLFYDCDQAVTGKEQNFYVMLNNTVVHQTIRGGLDTEGGVVNLADEGKAEGNGMYLEGNIIQDAEQLVRNQVRSIVTLNNNLSSLPWTGPGTGNRTVDPLLQHLPTFPETVFTTWEQAQVMRGWFGLQSASPALGRGPGGQDLGGVVPMGATVTGVPVGTTRATSVALAVGPNRVGNSIPISGWPLGAGYTHYRWRLDGGTWSLDTPIAAPIQVNGLNAGIHSVEVSGRRDSGLFQDDPLFGDDAVVTASAAWIVDPSYVPPPPAGLRLNEILAKNTSTFTSGESTPDLVEVFNDGLVTMDLEGVGVSDDPQSPYQYRFPAGTHLDAGAFLVLIADSDTASPGIHLGFALKQEGDSVSLHDVPARGGVLLDSVSFGLQVADLSVGRRSDGSWGLCQPTFGAPNVAVSTGDVRALRINEWLANARYFYSDDFIELYNPEERPVALDGLYLSDTPGTPALHRLPPLSFIASGACLALKADADQQGRPGHLSFKLAAETGTIHLSDTDLTPIDTINYGPQATDVSQGRTPSGSDKFAFFRQPSPGALNPGSATDTGTITYQSVPLLGFGAPWRYLAGLADPGTSWRNTGFDDSAWKSGAGPLGLETSSPYPYPLPARTPLPITAPSGTHIKTYYFRTHFQSEALVTGAWLQATNYLDDGAVYYLNGFRIGALRVSDNPARYDSDATLQPDEGQREILPLPADHLLAGDNVLAVEVHQSGGSSSDVMFGLALASIQSITNAPSSKAPSVMLNELFARNQSHPDADGHRMGWLELFNPGTNAVPLADLSLSDDPGSPRKWVFASDAILGPRGFLAVGCDASRPASATNSGFGLSRFGGAVFLSQRPAAGGAILDALHYGLQAADFSIGRLPDGGDDWILTVPGRGTPNVAAGLGSPSTLRLNEWMADPPDGSDWFEIYNADAAPVSLTGLAVTDDLGAPTQSPFPSLSFIGTGSDAYLQVLADNKPGSGANHAGFKLSKDGSELGLFAVSGLPLDVLSFGTQSMGVSEGRLPDGAETVTAFPTSPTPEAPNRLGGPAGDSDSDGMPDAWEDAHGLNRLVDDASEDADGDGFSNLDEYLAGTDPQSASSRMALTIRFGRQGGVELLFQGVDGRAYTVQSREDIAGSAWENFAQIAERTPALLIFIPVGDAPTVGRFYRVVTPAVP